MEVHFTLEQQARLAQIATQSGILPEHLVTHVVARFWFLEEDELAARIEAMFKA